jgi:hypothetical protein
VSPKKKKTNKSKAKVKTGAKHKVRAPLWAGDAFRCTHWLATMMFINIEKKHEGSLISWAKGFWFKFNYYEWEQKVVGKSTSAGSGAAISLTSFAVIAAVGTVLTGGIGAVVAIAIAAAFGLASGAVSVAISAICSVVYKKYAREKIDDRLNRSDFQERTETNFNKTMTEGGYVFQVDNPISLDQLTVQLDVSLLKVWEHPRNEKLRDHITNKSGDTAATDYLIPKGKKVWIPAKRDTDPKVGDFRHESRQLTRLVLYSLRDSVVHLRQAIAIYQKMPERITGGRYYTPGQEETYEMALDNIRKKHPEFDFLDDAPLYAFKNKRTLHKITLRAGDTLEKIAEAEDCPWNDILEFPENTDLRSFYVGKKLWPERKEVRQVAIEGVRNIWIPVGIVPNDNYERVYIVEDGHDLYYQARQELYYLPPGEPIWIPAAHSLNRESFKDCDDMIDSIQIAMEFVHHINKFRNYLLPCLNLGRLYLDVFEELAAYRNHAHAVIEDAVLDYMQFGEHRKCRARTAWQDLADNRDRTRNKYLHFLKSAMFGYQKDRFKKYDCMRSALQKARLQEGKPKTYVVKSDDESFDSIAAEHKIPVRTLVAYNAAKHKINPNRVSYNAKDEKWEFEQAKPGAGSELLIPGPNAIDKIIYGDIWARLGIGPAKKANKFSGDFSSNEPAKVALAEVPVDDIKRELDEMIDAYNQALEKNRETHAKKWYEEDGEKRRYVWMVQDILHGLDMPDTLTRIKHKFSNIDMMYTKGEKGIYVVDNISSVIMSGFSSALSQGTGAGADALFPKAGVLKALKDLAFQQPGPEFWKYAGKQGIKIGGKVITPVNLVTSLAITEGGGKASSDDTKKIVTKAHRLNFAKERAMVSAQLTGLTKDDASASTLKHATKVANDLFMKISRHAHWAFVVLQGKLVPMVGQLEKNSSKVGGGLKGCKDCSKHLKALYEYQHQVDKAERYLVATLALVKHLFDFEKYFTNEENQIREILEKSACKWIEQPGAKHAGCRKSKVLGKRHCYGPGKTNPAKPHKPLRSRPKWDKPARPSKAKRKPKSEVTRPKKKS